MGKSVAEKRNFTFVGGLNTEAGPLTFPPNTWDDGINVIPDVDGSISKRLALDMEEGYTYHSDTLSLIKKQYGAYAVGEWNGVAGTGDRNFLVAQSANVIRFYHNYSDPISPELLPFTIDMDSYRAEYNSESCGYEPISVASGNGKAIIVARHMKPLLVTYNPSSNTITVEVIEIRIRDFKGQNDGLATNERPTSLSAAHNYNLLNQGWTADKISAYTSTGYYPSNAQSWHHGKDSSDDFVASLLDKQDFGTSPAPKGRFIINPFIRDYSTVSGVVGLTTEYEAFRPTTCTFYAGRAWYAGTRSDNIGSWVMFSQVAQHNFHYGRCYQDADPTSEVVSDLIDSDGGVIPINDAGTIIKLTPFGRGVVVFASNGVWYIRGGGDTGFAATTYEVIKLSSSGCTGIRTVIEAENALAFWSQDGIFGVQAPEGGVPSVGSMSDLSIQSLYTDIPIQSKVYAAGTYHPDEKILYWTYDSVPNADSAIDRFAKDTVLCYDTRLKAWYKHSISPIAVSYPPYPTDIFITKGRKVVGADVAVVNNTGLDLWEEKWYQPLPDSMMSDAAVYVPSTNRYWISKEVTSGSNDWEIQVINADTGALVTTYSLPGTVGIPTPMVYDPVDDKVWMLLNPGYGINKRIASFNASTGANTLDADLGHTSFPALHVDQVNGTVVLVRQYNPTYTTFYKINKTTGAVDATFNSGVYMTAQEIDADGRLWIGYSSQLSYREKIGYITLSSFSEITNVYTNPVSTTSYNQFAYDSARDYMWITANGELSYKPLNLATGLFMSGDVTFTIGASGINGSAVVDAANDRMWVCRMYNTIDYALEARDLSSGEQLALFNYADIHGDQSTYYLDHIEVCNDGGVIVNGYHTDTGYFQVMKFGEPIVVSGYSTATYSSRERSLKFWTGINTSSDLYKYTMTDFLNTRNAPTKFKDWYTVNTAGAAYDAYLVTGYDLGGEGQGGDKTMQFLYVTVFMRRTETGTDGGGTAINQSSVKLQSRWDWTDRATPPNKWSAEQEVYRHNPNRVYNPADPSAVWLDGYEVVYTKNKVRGRGRAVQLKYSAHTDKDMQLLGWSAQYLGNSNV